MDKVEIRFKILVKIRENERNGDIFIRSLYLFFVLCEVEI